MTGALITVLSAGVGAFLAQFAAAFVKAKVGQGRYLEKCRDADLEALNAATEELRTCCKTFYSSDAKADPLGNKILATRIVGLFRHINGNIHCLFHPDEGSTQAAYNELKPIYRKVTGDQLSDPERIQDFEMLAKVEIWVASFRINNIRRRRKMRRSFLAD